jgi:circadian clock protein KaiC
MKNKAEEKPNFSRVSTGITALDGILWGGLPKGEIYLVNGSPGTGNTNSLNVDYR